MAANNSTNNKASVFTSDTSVTATAGNVALTAGNLALPTTISAGTAGVITYGGTQWMHTIGTGNIFIGNNAGNLALTTGTAQNNVGIGTSSLAAITTQQRNVAVGYQAMQLATSGGTTNTAVGYQALNALLTGSYNVCIGGSAGINYTGSESSNVCIMNSGTAAESNVMRIGTSGSGNGQVNTCFIAGVSGVTVANSAAVLMNTTTGQLGTVASSLRYKENVEDMGSDSEAIMKLRPVTFTWKEHPDHGKQYGLIAEEVAEVFPDIVVYNTDKQPETVQYHVLPAMLLNELQKQYKMINELEAHVAALESK